MTDRPSVAVVGGGITGLAAAWEASRLGAEVTVFEASERIGGKVAAHRSAVLGFAVETGPDAFLARVPWAVELCEALGLGDDLVEPAASGASVATRSGLHPLPSAQVLGIPADPDELAGTGLVSPEAVERVRAERSTSHAPLTEDRTIGSLVRERLGDEVCDHLVGALVGGINAGDVDALSLRAVTPQIWELARNGGSLVEQAAALVARRRPGDAVFLTPEAGLGVVVDRLSAGVEVRAGSVVRAVERVDRGWTVDGERFDAAVVATPAPVAAALLTVAVPDAADLAAVEYASVVMVVLVVERDTVDHPLDGTGFVVARTAGRSITACSWGSSKWAHWDDGRHAVFRVSLGHAGDPDRVRLPDGELVSLATSDLGELLGTRLEPVESVVTRWPRSFPQYRPGHDALVGRVHAAVEAAGPGLAVAGAGLEGLGIPACIRQGRQAARRVAG